MDSKKKIVEGMRGCTEDMVIEKNETDNRILGLSMSFDLIVSNYMFHKE